MTTLQGATGGFAPPIGLPGRIRKEIIFYRKKARKNPTAVNSLTENGGRAFFCVSENSALFKSFLLDFHVHDVAFRKFVNHVFKGDALLCHEHHYVVGKVGNFKYRLFLAVFRADDDFRALFPHLFQNFIYPLLEKVRVGRAFLGIDLSALDEVV